MQPDLEFIERLGIDGAQQFHDAIGGSWLEFDDKDLWADVCDLDEFLERDGREGATFTAKGVEERRGQQVVKVEVSDPNDWEALYVSTSEPHYLVRLDEEGDHYFEYDDYNDVPLIEVPPESEILTQQDVIERAQRN